MKGLYHIIIICTCCLLMVVACTFSKVNMMPNGNIPYRSGDKLLIMRLEAVKTYIANDLYQEAKSVFEVHPGIELLDESEVLFQIKQFGLDLPTYDNYKREGLEQIRARTGLDYIIVSKVLGKRQRAHEATNEATLSFKLYDLQAKTATVSLNIKTTISPLTWEDSQGGTQYFNPSSTSGAVRKAYKKAIKRFYKAFNCCN